MLQVMQFFIVRNRLLSNKFDFKVIPVFGLQQIKYYICFQAFVFVNMKQ